MRNWLTFVFVLLLAFFVWKQIEEVKRFREETQRQKQLLDEERELYERDRRVYERETEVLRHLFEHEREK